MAIFLNQIKEEISNIRTIELAKNTRYLVEKILWTLILIAGTLWFFYFMSFQFKIWSDSSTIKTKIKASLSDLDYPSITFCSKYANKYGVAERFGNYLDPKETINQEFLVWLRKTALNCTIGKHVQQVVSDNDLQGFQEELYFLENEGKIFFELCMNWEYPASSCKVSNSSNKIIVVFLIKVLFSSTFKRYFNARMTPKRLKMCTIKSLSICPRMSYFQNGR